MKQKLVLEFTKMNGAGNDFVVIDNRFYRFSNEELTELARVLCPRRTGIGADGLLAFAGAEDAAHHYRMRYHNVDGSLGTMCGNGARCLARYARHAGIEDDELCFESDAGVYRAQVTPDPDGPVRLYVQPPRHFTPNKPLASEAAMTAGVGPVHYIWPGVEHVVCFVDDVAAVPVDTTGRAIRQDEALAPAGANVNFVQVQTDGSLRVRTYEKGVEAETLACGTGALAAALVARLLNKGATMPVAVHMPGGVLTVGFRLDGEEVTELYLEGPATTVFRGTVEVDI